MKTRLKGLAWIAIAAVCYVVETTHQAYHPETWLVYGSPLVQEDTTGDYTIVRRRVITGKPKDPPIPDNPNQLLARYGE